MMFAGFDEVGNNGRQALQRRDLMDRDDAGVPQLGRRPGLALEALALGWGVEQPGARDLQRHDALQLRVASLPDRPEAALADPFEELELAQLLRLAAGSRWAGVLQSEGAAAGRAKHLVGVPVSQLQRIVTVGATDSQPLGSGTGCRRNRSAFRSGPLGDRLHQPGGLDPGEATVVVIGTGLFSGLAAKVPVDEDQLAHEGRLRLFRDAVQVVLDPRRPSCFPLGLEAGADLVHPLRQRRRQGGGGF
jgi:hypothetical protein